MKILVTGGMGFIGSNFVRRIVMGHPDWSVTNLDLLTYAAHRGNLTDLENAENYRFVHGDVADAQTVNRLMAEGFDAVVHVAAESHVDRSIADPGVFTRTNTLGTQELLEAARRHGTERFVLISTDEVYGSLGPTGSFRETSPLAPNSPYSASKASADLLARAYAHTYGFPVIITRCSNNYGPRQFPEKLIPRMILRALADEDLPIYGDGRNIRDWLHVDDHCAAIELALTRGRPGEIYNVGGRNERTNLEVATAILSTLGKPASRIRFVEDRPGHDRRYAIHAEKIRKELGWKPTRKFDEGLAETIAWYREHTEWWQAIQNGAYRRLNASLIRESGSL